MNKYYEILGITSTATEAEIKQAYRKLAKQWHPDRYVNQPVKLSEAEEKFKLICEAYSVIMANYEGVSFTSSKSNNDNSKTYHSQSEVKVESNSPEYYYQLAVQAAENDDFNEAIALFSLAIKANPEYREAYIYRANILEKQGFNLRANSDWRKAKELELKNRVSRREVYTNRTSSNRQPPQSRRNETTSSNQGNWKCIGRIQVHSRFVNDMQLLANENTLITVGGDRDINVWSLKDKSLLTSASVHSDVINTVALSPNNVYFATAGADQNIKIWNTVEERLHKTIGGWFSGHSGEVFALAFTPDNRYLVSASKDCTVRLWDVATGEEIWVYTTYAGDVLAVDIDVSGKFIATAGKERWLKILDRRSGRLTKSMKTNAIVTTVKFSQDGKILASGGFDRQVKLWDWRNKRLITSLVGHSEIISDLCFSPDGKAIVSASWDGTVKFWSLDSFQCLETVRINRGEINCLTMDSSNKTLIVGKKDGKIAIFKNFA